MKRIHLDRIESKYQTKTYQELYEKVMLLIEQGKIKPVKAAGKNGKKPALYKEYWLLLEQEDNSVYLEELYYLYLPMIKTDYYLHHLEEYKTDRKWLICLNQYLKTRKEELEFSQSINERSFAIWKREKFLKEEQGKKILKRCGLSLKELNLYQTTEPMSYFAASRETPQNLLIVENKDTFYSMRKHLLDQRGEILGCAVSTLIYGADKGILRSFMNFALCAEHYMTDGQNGIFYLGDLDYEGIGIYEKLTLSFGENRRILPFLQGYEKMLQKAEEIDIEELPSMKEGQNKQIGNTFLQYFDADQVKQMQIILKAGKYIPQEILSGKDF